MHAKTIHKEWSPISGKITVMQRGAVRELYVNGVKQSMWSSEEKDFNETYWEAASKIPFDIPTPSPQFLIFGLGGATIPKRVIKQFTAAHCLCLEIDPQIISIAKEYFFVPDYPDIKIIQANVNTWIPKNYKEYKNYFDGIWLDTFFGETFSTETENKMIQKIALMLNATGVLIINRIYNENEKNIDAFICSLQKIFSEQKTKIIAGYSGNDNIIIFNKTVKITQ